MDKNYGKYLAAMGFSVDEILRKAVLPEDLFSRKQPVLTEEEYFRFMRAVDALSPDDGVPVRLAAAEGMETFSPPVFASYCSRNGFQCLRRLAQYKPLIGALLYEIRETETEASVDIVSAGGETELPEILVGMEFVFLTGLLRKAAKEKITPLFAEVRNPMRNRAYEEFIGVPIEKGERDRLVFSAGDLQIPFISRNESMWEFFEPELRRRLSMMETDDTCAARVRSALMELLPGGEGTADSVAGKLGCSRRSLQRRLQEENTSFQKQLNEIRERLAKAYLTGTDMTAEEIAFLLGYQETGSFLRAFTAWTGRTAGVYREENRR